MPEITGKDLSGVAETLFLPLYIRAMESQRPDALIKDDQAVALTKQLNYDSAWIKKMMVDEDDKVSLRYSPESLAFSTTDLERRRDEGRSSALVTEGCDGNPKPERRA